MGCSAGQLFLACLSLLVDGSSITAKGLPHNGSFPVPGKIKQSVHHSFKSALFKTSASCYVTSACEVRRSIQLNVSVTEGNKTAVCSLLPEYIQCIETAEQCYKELQTDAQDRSLGLSRVQWSAAEARQKHKRMCSQQSYSSLYYDNGGNSFNKFPSAAIIATVFSMLILIIDQHRLKSTICFE